MENFEAVESGQLWCPVCEDPRQYRDPEGQVWLDPTSLTDVKVKVKKIASDAFSMTTCPKIGIGHTSYLLKSQDQWLLWDPLPVVLDPVEALIETGENLSPLTIAASHPHMYGAQSHWADSYGGRVLVNQMDEEWAHTKSVPSVFWKDDLQIDLRSRLVQLGGHFPGSSVLVWRRSATESWLFSSDTAQIRPNERFAFMWSYPNLLPLNSTEVERMVKRYPTTGAIKALDNFGRTLKGNVDSIFKVSAQAHIKRLGGTHS
ncbi:hypothetical protein [Corynebacterium glaucum]|nr:hypothetical protein [Corynebacterium glaucum]